VKLGIVSDIHEAVELLERALSLLALERVEHVVVLGDVFETGPRMDETVRLLEAARATGVYGNHDYGLSNEPSDYVRERFSPRVLSFMTTLLPRMEIDGAFFAHREPFLDCSEVTEIWQVDDEPLSPGVIEQSFAAVPNRSIFIGHFHCWTAFTRNGPMPWQGDSPLAMPEDEPTMVIVGAVCDGHAATFDTTTRVLTPIDLYAGGSRPVDRPLPMLVYD
jgi:Calcineurin-like phosphoesterase superfamily domain